jgi:hypothetical protein
MKFDWQTDEDGPLVPESGESEPGVTSGYRWLVWLGLPVVVLLSGFFIYYQLNQRVDAAHAEIEADVLAAFNLAQQALIQGDAELLATVLSRQDNQWFREWRDLAADGFHPLAIPPALTASPEMGITAVTLSTELNRAEIARQRPYTLHLGDGLTETIQLEQTDFYYKTVNGWLWTQPEDDYWGGWETWHGRYLTLIYPARDEALALRLAEALEAHLDSWCQGETPPFMRCPDRPPWELRLGNNPATLARLNQFDLSPTTSRNNWRFPTLPTPSLLGRPVDEAGYDALLRHYALQLGVSLARQSQQYPAAYSSPMERMQSVRWLAEAGLYLWPPSALPPALAEPPPADLVLHCAAAEGGSLWRYKALTGDWQPLLPELDVYEFAAWPDYDSLFVGTRHQENGEVWTAVSRYRDGRLIPIHRFQSFEAEGYAAGLHARGSGDDRRLILYASETPSAPPPNAPWKQYQLDSEACDEAGCPLTPLDNYFWEVQSPDGRHSLRFVFDQGPSALWLTDQQGALLRQVGRSHNFNWLSHERYVYIELLLPYQPVPQMRYQLNIGHIAQDEPEFTASLEELFTAQGVVADDEMVSFGEWVFNPVRSNQSVVVARRLDAAVPWSAGESLFFLLELDQLTPGEIEVRVLPTTIAEMTNSPMFDGDGRWLILIGRDGRQLVMELVDLTGPETRRVVLSDQPGLFDGLFIVSNYMPTSWSPDGRWLSLLHEGLVHLVELETANHAVLVPPQPGCINLAWLTE